MKRANWKPIGILGIFAGITSFIGLIDGISITFTAPIGIICGIIAVRKNYKCLGWVSIVLNILAPLIFLGLLYHYGWFDANH
ncbi:MAG TPA: hypothetical protein VLG11_05010 [Candidatus Saccharimonadales bacterium]|nr:hypothetical protein [Candidatus Saccharimonadales bacterium]